MSIFYFKLTLLLLCISFLTIISGCSTFIAQAQSPMRCSINIDYALDSESHWPDQKLKDTFCEYWTLRYNGNIQETYNMEAPQFQNQIPIEKYELYVKRTKSNTLDQLVIKAIGEENTGLTYIDCNFFLKAKLDKDFSSFIRDKWIRVEGEWFHAMRDPFFFPIVYE